MNEAAERRLREQIAAAIDAVVDSPESWGWNGTDWQSGMARAAEIARGN